MRWPRVDVAWMAAWALAIAWLMPPATAATVSHVQVRIVTGADELTAGSLVELRIYEAGKAPRHLQLTHGESWPRDSTWTIPVALTEPLDPRAVRRFALFYRAASVVAPPWEVVSAEVDLVPESGAQERLLNATLTGILSHQGELATEDRDPASLRCAGDADCDDHRKCNGHEKCAPGTAGADARGCVKGWPVVCPVNQVCTEDRGCRGIDTAPAAVAPPGADDSGAATAPASPSAVHR